MNPELSATIAIVCFIVGLLLLTCDDLCFIAGLLFLTSDDLQGRVDRWLARYLQRRGWVVFWLDGCARTCGPIGQEPTSATCWLKVYEEHHPAARGLHE